MMVPFYSTRRDFLSGSLRLLSGAATLPLFIGRTAFALDGPSTRPGRRDDGSRVLLIIQLAGGNDGLNTIVPYENDLYYKLRPQLAIAAKNVLRVKEGIGLHPAATGLKALYDSSDLAIVQGVGYPNPNRSHFVSMDIWHTADPQQRKQSGWLGRYFDACCVGADQPAPMQGIALMQESPLALQGERFAPLTFEDPSDLAWRAGEDQARAARAFEQLNVPDSQPAGDEPTLRQFLQRAALDARQSATQIRAAAGASKPRGRRAGRNAFGQQLQQVASMVAADLPTQVYYVSLGGFDTHAGQLGRHQQLLRQFGDGLQDFVATLRDDKLLDRVLVLVFSEFGRRVPENASGGTDHGEAAPVFLCGANVRPGVHGTHPALDDLHRGDLAFECDFRRIYAAVLRDWLKLPGRDLAKVLGTGVGPLEVLRR